MASGSYVSQLTMNEILLSSAVTGSCRFTTGLAPVSTPLGSVMVSRDWPAMMAALMYPEVAAES